MKSILLIGLGCFGKHLAFQLQQLDHQVMAVDINEEKVDAVLPYVTNAQIGDSTNEEFLQSLGVRNYDVCIVAIGEDFQSSLETTSLLKDLGAKQVVSTASTNVHEKFLLKNGADEILYPEKQLAKWAAIRYTADHILDYIELDEDHFIYIQKVLAANFQGWNPPRYDHRAEGILRNASLWVLLTQPFICFLDGSHPGDRSHVILHYCSAR